jgi:hypothetical protein
MPTISVADLEPLAPGLVLALLAILLGFLLGGAFGLAEDALKDQLRASADAVFDSAYQGDDKRRNAVVSKSWQYLKRAHLHAGAIGTAALASIAWLGLLGAPRLLEKLSALAFGAGALLYPIFWLSAGFSAPGAGSTGAAKEALSFLAIPGAGLCILGALGTLVCVVRRLIATSE